MFNQDNIGKIYSVFPDTDLPPSALPYAMFVKPIETFLLTCVSFARPESFVPFTTIKTAFELFVSAYLKEEYNPLFLLKENNKMRIMQRRRELEYGTRARAGGHDILSLPTTSFSSLLSTVLESRSFRKALAEKMDKDFQDGKITAGQLALYPFFLPYLERVSAKRIPVVFNVALSPIGNALPDKLLAIFDSRFGEAPDVSRSTYPRFNVAEQFRTNLDPIEINQINSNYRYVERAGKMAGSRNLRRFQQLYGDLVLAGVLKHADTTYINRAGLQAYQDKAIAGVVAKKESPEVLGVDTKASS